MSDTPECPNIFERRNEKDDKLYTVSLAERSGGSRGKHFVIIVSELSLPNEKGEWQRVRTIADCGNSDKTDNIYNAVYIAKCFAKGEILE